jgi:thiamine transport system permease protein
VFLFSFTSFGIVLYMGQGDLATLEVLLYENLRGAFPRLERAAALGILQLTLNFIVLSIYLRMLRRQIQVPREPASDRMPSRAGRWVGAAAAGVAIMPLVAVLTGGFQVRGKWSLEPWNALLRSNHPSHAPGFELGHAIGLSLGYAVASATIALALTICLAYGVRRLHPWAHTLASLVTALPLGTSSLLIGFGLILSTSVAFVADAANGRLLIIAAHALVAFPFTARTLLPAIAQLETRLDESARLLGASSWAVVGRVHLPLLAAPLIAALGLSLAMSLGDFGAGLLLMSAENRGISLWIDAIGGSVQFNPILRAQASALAGLLLLLAAAAYASAEWAIRRPA